jgi:hypothetical protein
MKMTEALQIIRQDPIEKEIDDTQRTVSGKFIRGVPRERILGWNDPKRGEDVLKLFAYLKDKQVWVIDAPLIQGPGVRGWNLQFFVDACDRKLLMVSAN